MTEDGLNNEFEKAHQNGLRRGFDLGWSYKGRFDRQIIKDEIIKIDKELKKVASKSNIAKQEILTSILSDLESHSANRENITINSW